MIGSPTDMTSMHAGQAQVTACVPHDRPRGERMAQMIAIPSVRHKMIAEAAYLRAAGRAFSPGRELEDWLLSEADIDAQLAGALPFAW